MGVDRERATRIRPRRRCGVRRAGTGRMSRPTLDAVADVLDHELVDADGLPCGMVDDVVLEGQPGASLAIVGLLVGPGAWLPRTMPPLRFFAQLMFGRERVRVPWSAVRSVGERIVLEQRAAHYGLGRTDRRLGRWIARIPGGDRAPE